MFGLSTAVRESERMWQQDLSELLQNVRTLDKVVSLNTPVEANAEATARLAPALAMLKGLLEDGKERIGKLNAREEESKKMYDGKKNEHEKRITNIDTRFREGRLSEEFHTNETRDEERLWKYWDNVRKRQHMQFKTALRIQRSTEQKVRTMINLYEDTMSGKKSKADIQKRLAKVSGTAQHVLVLFQGADVNAVRVFCKDEIRELTGLQKERKFRRSGIWS